MPTGAGAILTKFPKAEKACSASAGFFDFGLIPQFVMFPLVAWFFNSNRGG